MTTTRRDSPPIRRERAVPLRQARQDDGRGSLVALSLLALLTLAIFWPILRSQFIAYDDPDYVTQNPHVRMGLTGPGVLWALTSGYASNWHPLTWLSHMADVSLFGLNPSGHHATSLLLHLANTILLFLLLRRWTESTAKSAWVAAIFAIHPAHVQSVAWIAERKDVLSTLLGLAAIWVYAAWTRRRGAARYAVLVGVFAAGLMAKPMLVTLPILFLLLDYWPLDRLYGDARVPPGSASTPKMLIVEKIPLFLVSASSGVIAFLAQRSGGAVQSLETFPLSVRVGNSIVSYVHYLRMLFWPANLAVYYPRLELTPSAIIGSALLLVSITTAAIALRRKAPYLPVGWLWFVVTLLPVIGLVQVGTQPYADRYTYLPFIGLFIVLAWGVPALLGGWRHSRIVLRAAALLALAGLAPITAAQVRTWKDSETLLLHAIEVTRDNNLALNNLGAFYNVTGRPAQAMPFLEKAVANVPQDPTFQINLGHSLFLLGRTSEAERRFSSALRLRPGDAVASSNLAWIRFRDGDVEGSIPLYRSALAAAPSTAAVHARLATALLLTGKTEEAVGELERAALLDPNNADILGLLAGARAFRRSPSDPAAGELRSLLTSTHRAAGEVLRRRGKNEEAEAHFRSALTLSPSDGDAHAALGRLLTEENRFEEALSEFRVLLSFTPGSAAAHNDLGYVLFRMGQRSAAIEQYLEALRIQPDFPLAQNNLKKAREMSGRN